MKRALDVVLATLLLLLTSPLFVVVALLVRASSRGPTLHRAVRVGKDGREFVMYKLRTMRLAPGPAITSAGDTRITPVGRVLRRSRLDELPQLWNVLRGEMSLVGPRPEDPRFVALYSPEERQVLTVWPGITGPAQLASGTEEDSLPAEGTEAAYVRDVLPRKLRRDLAYVRGRSLRGDLGILLRTVAAPFRRGGQAGGRSKAR